jgi:hypothetical protein
MRGHSAPGHWLTTLALFLSFQAIVSHLHAETQPYSDCRTLLERATLRNVLIGERCRF